MLPHLALEESSELRDGQRRPVLPAHKQALENNFVELALRAPHKKAIKLRVNKDIMIMFSQGGSRILYLNEQPQVHILALRGDPSDLLVTATGLKIDTLDIMRSPS